MQEHGIGDRSTDNGDFTKEDFDDVPMESLVVHAAGFDDASGVVRILDVRESREHADRFMEHVMSVSERPRVLPAARHVRSPTQCRRPTGRYA